MPGVWDKHTEDPAVRFKRLFIGGPGCWEWTGKTLKTSAGPKPKFTYGSRLDGSRKDVYASRFAWELWVSPIPPYLDVCHECDNMMCVRPSHLWLGTRAENNRDRCFKGRCRGHSHGRGRGRPAIKYALGKDP